jgi:hypothetical protein
MKSNVSQPLASRCQSRYKTISQSQRLFSFSLSHDYRQLKQHRYYSFWTIVKELLQELQTGVCSMTRSNRFPERRTDIHSTILHAENKEREKGRVARLRITAAFASSLMTDTAFGLVVQAPRQNVLDKTSILNRLEEVATRSTFTAIL